MAGETWKNRAATLHRLFTATLLRHANSTMFCIHLVLTLGAHAQRGLLYLVCVSVCVCLHLFSPYRDQAGSSAIPTALAQQGLEKLCGDFA